VLGDRIKQLRKEKGLSQAELGKLVGLSYAQIGRYEKKGMQPSAEVLNKIAEALGASPDFLLNGSAEEKAANHLSDKELIQQFKEVEQMAEEDKSFVKRFLDAFITKIKLDQITA
jgi:transcriptional regulator with XRE-family HTH domain